MNSDDLKQFIGDTTKAHAMLLMEDAHIKPHLGVSSTEYAITGHLQAVLRAIESIFTQYPGLGYGTCVHQLEQLSDGSYGARMSRSNSCD